MTYCVMSVNDGLAPNGFAPNATPTLMSGMLNAAVIHLPRVSRVRTGVAAEAPELRTGTTAARVAGADGAHGRTEGDARSY